MATLITGGNGFIGLNLAERLLAQGRTVVTVSRGPLPEPARRELSGHGGMLVMEHGDVRDREGLRRIMADHAVDRVFHGAIVTADRRRELNSAYDIVEINVMGTIAVLDAARQQNASRFVYASSGAVYGDSRFAPEPLDETAPVAPATLYGITKVAGEMLVRRYSELWGMSAVSARINAVFGPWERDTGVRDTLSPILGLAAAALHGGPVGCFRGSPQDWIYARDVAEACGELLMADALAHDVYNIAPGSAWDVAKWIDRLEVAYPGFSVATVDTPEQADVVEHTPPDRVRTPVSNGRIRELIADFPRHGADAALDDYLDWIGDHVDFVTGAIG